jgi:D-alanyl-D-alanine carboxypeptidase/D-alanyl-D-alanine-endopeptidase (penicillin-binding protein 4)
VNHGFADFPPPVPVDDPAAYAAEQLTVRLQRAAIEVTDAPASGATPADAPVLASLVSPPLSDIAAAMLTSSDNTTAELLLRELARSTGGPATTEAGTAALVRTIASLDVDVNGAAPLDGSGLAPDDRLSCTTLLDALELADPAVDEGLADAGSTGTLATRFIGHPLEGALHAKTGQINGVVGFAGLIDGEGERPTLRFAFLANGDFDTEAGQALQVAVVDALASYPDAPPASDLVPDSE